jgi:iron uptake system component EfeO
MSHVRPFGVLSICAAALFVAGCGSTATKGGETVRVGLSDAGCSPATLKLASGPKNFEIAVSGTGKVTEYEILDGTRIIAERENLVPGMTSRFSVDLPAGEYTSYCPHGTSSERGRVIVSGGAGAGTSPQLKRATAAYAVYVNRQLAELTRRTAAFTAAIRSGDTAEAKRLYAATRAPFERIEPVAESFGELDPRIDARENDVAAGERWTGFHRIEKALFAQNTTKGLGPYADQLTADVARLSRKARTLTYQPAELANGATGLLDEISKSKITGEEDRYSRTDLWDIAASLEGSQKAYELLRPALAAKNRELARQIDGRYAAVDRLLAKYRRGEGFVLYTALGPADTQKLSQAIDALAEPLSHVASNVVGG